MLITFVKSNMSNEILTCKHKICCWSALKSNVGWSADVLWSLLQSITTFTISSSRLSFKRTKQTQQKIMLCCINVTKVYKTPTGQQLCSISYRSHFYMRTYMRFNINYNSSSCHFQEKLAFVEYIQKLKIPYYFFTLSLY